MRENLIEHSLDRPGKLSEPATTQQTSPRAGPLLIYGAYGKTGSMVVRVAQKRGHQVILAGADRQRLDQLSAEVGARGAQARLDSPLELRQIVRHAACVIHVAGPFAATFRPMLEACSAEDIPYVDLNGELDVFQAMGGFVDALQPRIPVVSGVGFGVAAGECAAMHAASQLAKPERIWLGLAPGLGLRSPGALRSTLRTVARGGAVLQDGRFVSERVGRRSIHASIGGRPHTFVSMPLGEMWAIQRSTGVNNVIGGAAVPAAERLLLQSGALKLLSRSEAIRNWMASHLSHDSVSGTQVFESLVWARAEDSEGRSAETVLSMGEGYQWSAEAAVRAAEYVALERRPGLWTPGQYFGKHFALSVTGTKVS